METHITALYIIFNYMCAYLYIRMCEFVCVCCARMDDIMVATEDPSPLKRSPLLPFSEPLNSQVFNYKYLFCSITVALKRIQAKQTAPLNKGRSINWSKKRPAGENLMLIVTKTF